MRSPSVATNALGVDALGVVLLALVLLALEIQESKNEMRRSVSSGCDFCVAKETHSFAIIFCSVNHTAALVVLVLVVELPVALALALIVESKVIP